MKKRPGRRLLRLLSSRSGPWIAVALGLALAAPGLFSGYATDDFLHRLIIEHALPDYSLAPWSLYDFTGRPSLTASMIDRGFLPWFSDPAFELRFFRPLSSLSLALDHWLFGREPIAAHLSSWLCLAVLLGAVAMLYRRVLRPAEATLATLLYGVSNAHDVTTAWIAARHSVLGGALAAIAITLHVAGRQEKSRARRIGSLLALALGLVASETALGAVAFIAAYELIVATGTRAKRALAAAPSVALAALHLGHYVWAGYGVRGSASYVSPFSDPLAFARLGIERLPVLAADALGGVPSMIDGAAPAIRPVTTTLGVLLALTVGLLVFGVARRARPVERLRHRWLVASALLALTPVVGGFLGGRLLVLVSIGGSAALSVGMIHATLAAPGHPRRRLLGAAVIALLAFNLGLGPLWRLAAPLMFRQMGAAQSALARDFDATGCGDADTLLLTNASDPTFSMYLGPLIGFHRPELAERLRTVASLSMTPVDQRLSRVDEGTLELETVGPRVTNDFERTFRGEPVRLGEVVQTAAFEATVVAVEDGRPTRVRFALTRPDAVCLGRWDGEDLRAEPLPAVGEGRDVPFYPGPMGL